MGERNSVVSLPGVLLPLYQDQLCRQPAGCLATPISGPAELCRQPAGCLATPIPGPAELCRQPAGCLATPISGPAELCRQTGCLATTTCILGQAEPLCRRLCGVSRYPESPGTSVDYNNFGWV